VNLTIFCQSGKEETQGGIPHSRHVLGEQPTDQNNFNLISLFTHFYERIFQSHFSAIFFQAVMN